MLIPLRRNHVVLCGLGYVGFEFLRQLRLAGYKAIVIESDPDNPRIKACRDWGYPVVVGDAQLKSTLEAAGVQRAARLLAVTPDSVVNTEIITRARRLVDNTRRLQCLARVNDPSLCVFLRIEESNHGDDQTALDFFNTDEIGARSLLDRHPFTVGPQPHILVAHLDTLGSELILHAARTWNDKRADSSTPLQVTVVDKHAGEQIGALLDEHPALEQVCTFTGYSLSVRDLARLHNGAGAAPISHAYVTAQRDEQSVETALKLRHALDLAVPVVAALWRAYGVADLLEHSTTSRSANLAAFKMLQETCTMELVEGGSFEAIAHEIHRRYRLMQPDGGKSVPPWSLLDESLKKSNRAHARHIGVKLRSIGCEIIPLNDWQAKDFTFTSDELTKLSIMEHDRWAAEKIADGWTLGDEDPKLKKDPHLVPSHELPPDVAEWAPTSCAPSRRCWPRSVCRSSTSTSRRALPGQRDPVNRSDDIAALTGVMPRSRPILREIFSTPWGYIHAFRQLRQSGQGVDRASPDVVASRTPAGVVGRSTGRRRGMVARHPRADPPLRGLHRRGLEQLAGLQALPGGAELRRGSAAPHPARAGRPDRQPAGDPAGRPSDPRLPGADEGEHPPLADICAATPGTSSPSTVAAARRTAGAVRVPDEVGGHAGPSRAQSPPADRVDDRAQRPARRRPS